MSNNEITESDIDRVYENAPEHANGTTVVAGEVVEQDKPIKPYEGESDTTTALRIKTPKSDGLALKDGGFDIRTEADLYRIAQTLIRTKSPLIGGHANTNDLYASMIFLHSIGANPIAHVQHVAVINDKLSIYGDAMLAIAYSSGLLERFEERFEGDEDSDEFGAYCCAVRKGVSGEHSCLFTVKRAKKAGLWGRKGPWANYPWRMLQMRARGFVLRDTLADAFGGLIIREEADDYGFNPDKMRVMQNNEKREQVMSELGELPPAPKE